MVEMTSTNEAATAQALPDWGGPSLRSTTARLWVLTAAFAVMAALGAAGATRLFSGEWSLWLPIAILVAAPAGTLWRASRQGARVLRSLGAKRLSDQDAPRFSNVVGGLSEDLKVARPGLWLVEGGGPNALVTWSGGPQIAVTRGLVDTFTRTECEAVAAFCMIRLLSGEARHTTYLLAMSGSPEGTVGTAVDAATVALTRYPPALVSALGKLEPSEAWQPLWMVGDPRTHESVDRRIAFLTDL